jgi:hypothetical protein
MLPWTFFIKKCVMPFLTASSMARTTKWETMERKRLDEKLYIQTD